MRLFAISGSLKTRSTNAAVLRTLAELAPDGTSFDLYDEELAGVPPFSPDRDGEGDAAPSAVADLRARLGAAAAIVVASPEYAHGVPGALKNAFDWVVSSGELTDKPLLLLVTSASGGAFARAAWREIFTVMGGRVVADEAVIVPRGGWNAEGRLVHDAARAQLADALKRLLASV